MEDSRLEQPLSCRQSRAKPERCYVALNPVKQGFSTDRALTETLADSRFLTVPQARRMRARQLRQDREGSSGKCCDRRCVQPGALSPPLPPERELP